MQTAKRCHESVNRFTYLFFTSNSRYRIRILFRWTISTDKMQTTNIAIFRTHERVTAMAGFYPLLSPLVLSYWAWKMKELDGIAVLVPNPRFRIPGIVFTSTISASFSRDHSGRLQRYPTRVF